MTAEDVDAGWAPGQGRVERQLEVGGVLGGGMPLDRRPRPLRPRAGRRGRRSRSRRRRGRSGGRGLARARCPSPPRSRRRPPGAGPARAGSIGSPPVTTMTVLLALGAAMCRFPPPALPGSGSSGRWRALRRGHPLSPATPSSPSCCGPSYPPPVRSPHAAHALRGRARAVPRFGPGVHRQGAGPPPRGVGAGRHRRPGPVHQGRRPGVPRHGRARGARRRRRRRLPLQPRHRRGDPEGGRERRRPRVDAPQRHLPAVLPDAHAPTSRRPAGCRGSARAS